MSAQFASVIFSPQSATEYFKNIGICCISKLQTKRLQHDILVSYNRKDSELPALVFYETDTTIVHVKKRKDIFTIKNIEVKSHMVHQNYDDRKYDALLDK